MDSELAEILSAIQEQARKEPEESSSPQPSPEDLRDQAAGLSSAGERREALDTLRRAVIRGESIGATSTRMIPILEATAELLWQMGEKREARLYANRALQLWFAAQPSTAFDLAVEGEPPS